MNTVGHFHAHLLFKALTHFKLLMYLVYIFDVLRVVQ